MPFSDDSVPLAPASAAAAPPTRRSRKRLWITIGVVLALWRFLDINPLHPVQWTHSIHEAYLAGRRARHNVDAARLAKQRAAASIPATPIPATPIPAR